jgi:hypothetical protein
MIEMWDAGSIPAAHHYLKSQPLSVGIFFARNAHVGAVRRISPVSDTSHLFAFPATSQGFALFKRNINVMGCTDDA